MVAGFGWCFGFIPDNDERGRGGSGFAGDVSGTLKLDYGTFALSAKLKRLDLMPTPVCAK